MPNIDWATAAAKANTTRGGGERAGVEREREREREREGRVGRQADRQTDFRLG
jgi:hypothetical protein